MSTTVSETQFDVTPLARCARSISHGSLALNCLLGVSGFAVLTSALVFTEIGIGFIAVAFCFAIAIPLRLLWRSVRRGSVFAAIFAAALALSLMIVASVSLVILAHSGVIRVTGYDASDVDSAISEQIGGLLIKPFDIGGLSRDPQISAKERDVGSSMIASLVYAGVAGFLILKACIKRFLLDRVTRRLNMSPKEWFELLRRKSRIQRRLPPTTRRRIAFFLLCMLALACFVAAGLVTGCIILTAVWGPIPILINGLLWGLAFKGRTAAVRRLAVNSSIVLSVNQRPPVLLLRSFTDDELAGKKSFLSVIVGNTFSFEERLVVRAQQLGPVVAIGKPGEELPPVGAAREYVPDDRWQERVTELVHKASFIPLILAATRGVEWEVKKIIMSGAIGKLLLIIPPFESRECDVRWQAFVRDLNGIELAERLKTVSPRNCLIVCFDLDGIPRVITSKSRLAESYDAALLVAASIAHLRLAY